MTKLNDSEEEKLVTSEESMKREMETLLLHLFAGSSVQMCACAYTNGMGGFKNPLLQQAVPQQRLHTEYLASTVLLSLPLLVQALCASRVTLLRHRLGRAMLVVLYTVTLQVVFIHMNRTMKHVQHVSWPQPCCEMANYGYFQSADGASFSFSVMNYYSLSKLSYSFRKGILMSCTS